MIAAVSLLAPQRLCAANELAGRVQTLTGTVTAAGAGKRGTLKAGDSVFVRDRIVTGARSSVEIAFIDGSRMKLAEDTTLEITEYQYDPAEKIRRGLISLISGKARFVVRDFRKFNDDRFRVETETAAVGSRDTDFIVACNRHLPAGEVCPRGLTTALCILNSIIVFNLRSPDRPALLTADMISRVCGPDLPTPPHFSTAAELAEILAGLDRMGNTKIRPPRMPGGPAERLPNSK